MSADRCQSVQFNNSVVSIINLVTHVCLKRDKYVPLLFAKIKWGQFMHVGTLKKKNVELKKNNDSNRSSYFNLTF